MFVFYVDEGGSPNSHSEPLQDGQTPLFVIASLAFQADCWRSLDRAYRDLKSKFLRKEIGNRRPEQYEVKGSDIVRPSNATSRRRHTFMRHALTLCQDNNAAGFAVVFKKDPLSPTSKTSLYNMGMQYVVERFSRFLEETSEGVTPGFTAYNAQGMIVADSRMKNLDMNVALSHLSFIFGHSIGKTCKRVIEAPTFTYSQLSVGVQLTDLFASALYAQYYRRMCSTIPKALDYSHMTYVEDFTKKLQWQAQKPYQGYTLRGYRILDHSVPP